MKRCKSKSPVHDLRCELERSHDKANPRSLHKSGDIVWGNDGTHQHGVPLLDLLRRGVAGLEFDTTPLAEAPITKLFAEDRFGSFDELAGRSTSAAHELAEWWRATSEVEIEQTVEKATEYSATDLIDIGRSMARAAGHRVDDAHAAELAVAFYALGKVSRIMGAIERGQLPNMDSWFDLGVYARMAQRIRDTGGWPGTEGGI